MHLRSWTCRRTRVCSGQEAPHSLHAVSNHKRLHMCRELQWLNLLMWYRRPNLEFVWGLNPSLWIMGWAREELFPLPVKEISTRCRRREGKSKWMPYLNREKFAIISTFKLLIIGLLPMVTLFLKPSKLTTSLFFGKHITLDLWLQCAFFAWRFRCTLLLSF